MLLWWDIYLENATSGAVQELSEFLSEVSLILDKLLERFICLFDFIHVGFESLLPRTHGGYRLLSPWKQKLSV